MARSKNDIPPRPYYTAIFFAIVLAPVLIGFALFLILGPNPQYAAHEHLEHSRHLLARSQSVSSTGERRTQIIEAARSTTLEGLKAYTYSPALWMQLAMIEELRGNTEQSQQARSLALSLYPQLRIYLSQSRGKTP